MTTRRPPWLLVPFLLASLCAPVAGADRPTVIELFTSQGCSSCPPAERVLLRLADTRPDVFALAFHVDYWDRLGWKDPYSSRAATDRQRAYQTLVGSDHVYTPQAVVDGKADVLGSDPDAVDGAVRRAGKAAAPVPIELSESEGQARVRVGSGRGQGTALIVGYDARVETAVRRGENAGRLIAQANVVRFLAVLGTWSGREVRFDVARPPGERLAVLLQAPDGTFLGLAR